MKKKEINMNSKERQNLKKMHFAKCNQKVQMENKNNLLLNFYKKHLAEILQKNLQKTE